MSNATKTRTPKTPEARREAYPRLWAWFQAALSYGTVYYRCDVGRTGMAASVLLWTISDRDGDERPALNVAWPDDGAAICGFSVKRRAFRVGGCGFNRVDHVIDSIAGFFGVTDWRRAIRDEQLNRPE